MASSTATLALREMYETQFEIFNHDAPNVAKQAPLALVAMHRKEDPYTYSMERHYFWRFRKYRLSEKWGVSLNDWLQLPFHIAEDLLIIEQRLAEEDMRRLKQQEEEERRRQREAEAQRP